MNRIESDHIARLQPQQLVRLLRLLLYAEAKQRNASVHVPLQIYFPDGGEDGRWEGEVVPNEYIPDKLTVYQVKAQSLDTSDCASAMLAPDGQRRIEPKLIRDFAYGSVLDSFVPSDLVRVLRPLAESIEEARPPIFEVVSMYVFRSEERWRACRGFLRELALSPRFAAAVESTMDGYHWQEAATKILSDQRDEELALALTRQILEAQTLNDSRIVADTYHRAVLGLIFARYPGLCWPLIGSGVLSPNNYLLRMLLGGHGFDDRETSILWNVPAEIMIGWVRGHRDALPFLLNVMTLFIVDESGGCRWHPTALALFNEGLDEACVGAVTANLFSYGSTGSRVPYIERRLRLLRSLSDHPLPRVREMAAELAKAFEQDKKQERKKDEELSAGIF